MREFLKLDVIIRKISALSKKEKKIAQIVKITAFAFTVFKVIAVIWSLVPKEEKFDEVRGDELLDAVSVEEAENEEALITEPVPASL